MIDARELIRQIGTGTLMAVSGLRKPELVGDDTVRFKCGNGYYVDVTLNGLDYYDVKRVFIRSGKVTVKGSAENMDFTQVSGAVYAAGMFRDDFDTVLARNLPSAGRV